MCYIKWLSYVQYITNGGGFPLHIDAYTNNIGCQVFAT